MDDTYKILLAAAVGFILSPLNEITKQWIGTKLIVKKLDKKIRNAILVLNNAISGINSTALEREQHIAKRDLESTVFILPYLQFPKMEEDTEKSFSALSENKHRLLNIAMSGLDHIKKLTDKIGEIEEELRNEIHTKNYNHEKIEKEDLNKFHRRILSCEKAILYSLVTVRQNFKLALKDAESTNTDRANIINASEELDITIKLSWWPHLEEVNAEVANG